MIDDVGVVGPTSLQVGASLAAAVCWGILNPNSGANFPENLPSEFILKLALPWLGEWKSVAHDWRPCSDFKLESSASPSMASKDSSESSSSDDSDEENSDDDESDASEDSDASDSGSLIRINGTDSHLRSPSPPSHCKSRDTIKNRLQFQNFVSSPVLEYTNL
jgi:hypothetical protein